MARKTAARIAAIACMLAMSQGSAATKHPAADTDAIFKSAENGKLADIQKFLAHGGSPDAADADKLTLLNWAAYGGALPVVKLLVAKHADVNVHASSAAWTPLMNASARGFPAIVTFLLDHGADIDPVDSRGFSALAFAAAGEHPDVVRLLLARGADGGKALVGTVRESKPAAVTLLLESGVNADATPREKVMYFTPGETALFSAAYQNEGDLVSLLLERGANPNISTPAGGNMPTPLSMAAYYCNAAMIDALLAHGASRSATNSSGETAADLARTGWTNNMKPCSGDIVSRLTP